MLNGSAGEEANNQPEVVVLDEPGKGELSSGRTDGSREVDNGAALVTVASRVVVAREKELDELETPASSSTVVDQEKE